MTNTLNLLWTLTFAVTSVGTAYAQSYPSRPVRLVIPLGVGGSSDILARLIAPRMTELLGQSVVVDNRPGGAGLPAHALVAKASPDGYTLILAGSNFAANPILFRKLPYDTEKDFAPISLLAIIPMVLVVHPSLPVQTPNDLVALVRSKPNTLNFGSVGNGSGPHLTAEVFNNALGLQVEHVPYKGAAAVMSDMIAGRLTYMFATTTSSRALVASGKVKALAVSSRHRSAALPGIPTLAEGTVPGFDVNIWQGVLAPGGTEPAIINRLNSVIAMVLQDPEVKKQFQALGAEAGIGTPTDFQKHIRSELARWVKLAKSVKFEVAN